MAFMLRLPNKTPDAAPPKAASPVLRFPAWSRLRRDAAVRREAVRRTRGGLA